MKENASEHARKREEEAKEFLKINYPFNRKWVQENLEVLENERKRKTSRSDEGIVSDAIQLTESFARQSGINLRPKSETDVTHIPSRLEAIREFEKESARLYKQLSLDRMVKIFILAEAASVQGSIGYASSEVAQDHLNKLTELVRIHRDLTGGL